jgi:hypothetical protein
MTGRVILFLLICGPNPVLAQEIDPGAIENPVGNGPIVGRAAQRFTAGIFNPFTVFQSDSMI